ncbi:MAG: flagellar biosynthesis protein FliQ [Hydrogenophilus sp.]|nr:flagellar biosynthesis protein FliQ [Hydrogenophilus sp.]
MYAALFDLARDAIITALLLSAPPFLAALITGLIISIFQAATQINEMTLTFVPKFIAVVLTLIVMGPWMGQTITDFTLRLMHELPQLIT